MSDYRNDLIREAMKDPRKTFVDGVWDLRDREHGHVKASSDAWPFARNFNILDFKTGRPIG